jgi:DNA-binding transcriptional ArsR family regulator
MRKNRSLDALFPRTRQAVLAATLLCPDRWWYLSDLARNLRVTPSSLQRELSALVDAGILRRRSEGNRVYYQPDPDCPFLGELQGLLSKTAGLADILKEALQPYWQSIKFAFVFGSIARQEETSASDVDLMIVGDVGLSELSPALREAERRIHRSINPAVYSWEEFSRRTAANDHFLSTVMRAEKLFLKGNDDELAEALIRPAGSPAHHQPSGA